MMSGISAGKRGSRSVFQVEETQQAKVRNYDPDQSEEGSPLLEEQEETFGRGRNAREVLWPPPERDGEPWMVLEHLRGA